MPESETVTAAAGRFLLVLFVSTRCLSVEEGFSWLNITYTMLRLDGNDIDPDEDGTGSGRLELVLVDVDVDIVVYGYGLWSRREN